MLEEPTQVKVLAGEITKAEQEGDRITHETVAALHQTWITPLDREEIHALICGLDDVLDFVEAASDWVVLYEVDAARPEAIELATSLCAAAEDVAKAVAQLHKLKDPKPVLDLCVSINKHEHEADVVFRQAVARLFKDKPDPFEVMRWRDILESMETATDRAEDVANIIEGIVLEHA
jgi:predicted phosphate transport protein (TIGR00153 family)